MLSDNLKALRKNKGYSQEELASRLNVVRQTISKWEKGLSVPDADLLQRLAEALEVSVGDLLGAQIPESSENADLLVEQLSRINEQLAAKNRRARRIWKTVAIVLIAAVVLQLALIVFSYAAFSFYSYDTQVQTQETITQLDPAQ